MLFFSYIFCNSLSFFYLFCVYYLFVIYLFIYSVCFGVFDGPKDVGDLGWDLWWPLWSGDRSGETSASRALGNAFGGFDEDGVEDATERQKRADDRKLQEHQESKNKEIIGWASESNLTSFRSSGDVRSVRLRKKWRKKSSLIHSGFGYFRLSIFVGSTGSEAGVYLFVFNIRLYIVCWTGFEFKVAFSVNVCGLYFRGVCVWTSVKTTGGLFDLWGIWLRMGSGVCYFVDEESFSKWREVCGFHKLDDGLLIVCDLYDLVGGRLRFVFGVGELRCEEFTYNGRRLKVWVGWFSLQFRDGSSSVVWVRVVAVGRVRDVCVDGMGSVLVSSNVYFGFA